MYYWGLCDENHCLYFYLHNGKFAFLSANRISTVGRGVERWEKCAKKWNSNHSYESGEGYGMVSRKIFTSYKQTNEFENHLVETISLNGNCRKIRGIVLYAPITASIANGGVFTKSNWRSLEACVTECSFIGPQYCSHVFFIKLETQPNKDPLSRQSERKLRSNLHYSTRTDFP